MLDGDMMKTTHNTTLEQRPERLHRVDVGLAFDEADSVDCLMEQVAPEHPVAPKFIAVNHLNRVFVDVVRDELEDGFALEVGDGHALDLTTTVFGALNNANDGGFLAVFAGTPRLVTLAANISIVGFEDAAQLVLNHVVFHCVADSMTEIPSGLISNSQVPLELVCGDSLLGFTNQVDCQEPLAKRKMGSVHNRAGCDRKLVFALGALIALVVFQSRNRRVGAPWAGNAL